MAQCKTVSYTVPSFDPRYGFGNSAAVTVCVTHQMQMSVHESRCPIGRIEDAAEAAIARIDEHVRQPTERTDDDTAVEGA